MSSETESWIKPIVFIVTFLGLFILLLGLMPSGFTPPSSTQYSLYDVPANFDARELGGVQYFKQHNVTFSLFGSNCSDFDFNPSVKYLFRVYAYSNPYYYLIFKHLVWYWGPSFLWQWEFMDHADFYGYRLEREDVETKVDSSNKSKFFPVSCPHISITVWISDANATRNDVLASWDDGQVTVSIGLGSDVTTAGIGGWDILGRLLTFQAPEILGMTGDGATILNYAIALPIWAMIGYLITRLLILIFKPFG